MEQEQTPVNSAERRPISQDEVDDIVHAATEREVKLGRVVFTLGQEATIQKAKELEDKLIERGL